MGISVSAQTMTVVPDTADSRSAVVVFEQNFEGNWDEWKATVIDSITEIQYYDNTSSTNQAYKIWEKPDEWQLGPVRKDSLIYIYNGEMTVMDSGERAKGAEEWGDDPDDPKILAKSASLVAHPAEDAEQFFDYGVADKGGSTYFKFESDTVHKGGSAYSGGLAARYRRNLFVRLNPGDIEENSSYRLTFFVKAKVRAGHKDYSATPTVYADVMRGYYHSEKPFSMGYIDYDKDKHPYEYANTFEYTKNDFYADKNWDNWEKVTFMTYYTTDSIAEYFMYKDGYWWAADDSDGNWEASWLWKKGSKYGPNEGDTLKNDLRMIQQPDKFFVRLGFPGDYTDYSIDNISLTKSWIGGCEYYQDKMRVNFGYKTNLKDLVAKNKKDGDHLDQIELPASYFQVYCLNKGADPSVASSWFQMPMRSAEYHSDGYLYLFTMFIPNTDQALSFGDYDRVLVCFQNPTDERIQLKYTDAPFPKGNDSIWIQNGKIVPDFVNELATPNPSGKVWKGVHSKFDLPPVCVGSDYVEGEFGLEPVSSMEFAFSRKVLFDDDPATLKAIAYVDGQKWNIAYGSSDTILVISNPSGQPVAAGDHTVELVQLVGVGTEEGEDVIRHLHFGPVSRSTEGTLENLHEYWNSKFDDEANSADQCLPEGTALYVWTGNGWSGYTEYWDLGDGSKKNDRCRLYTFPGAYTKAFNLNSRGCDRNAHMYFGVTENYKIDLQRGDYSLNFAACGINNAKKTWIYLIPWDPDNDNWDEKLQRMTKVSSADKILLKEYTPARVEKEGIRTAGKELDMLEKLSLEFRITEPGRYIIEFEFQGAMQFNGFDGILFSNLTINAKPSVSYNPINGLNATVDAATARINAANDSVAIYGGSELEALIAKRDFYNYDPEGGFKPYPTDPAEWYAARDTLNKYVTAVATRMGKVDDLVSKINSAKDKIKDFDSVYMHFDVTAKLQALIDSATYKFAYTTETTANMDKLGKALDDAATAVTNRKDKNDKLADAIAAAQKQIDQKVGHEWAEYTVLSDTLTEAKALDAALCRDGEVDTMTTKLNKAEKIFAGKLSGYNARTAPLKELRDIAKDLEADDVDTWQLNNFVDTTQAYDAEIADIYKTAIKLALYQIFADDPSILAGGMDITPFLNNYNLRAINNEPYFVTDKKLADGDDYKSDDLKGKAHPGSIIMNINHNYGNDAVGKKAWVLMYDSAYANVFPGWTVMSIPKKRHSVVSPDITCNSDHIFDFLRFEVPEFDGALTMDWNSHAMLKSGLNTDLPVGIYALSTVGNQGRSDGDSDTQWTLKAVTTDSTYVEKGSTKASTADFSITRDSFVVSDGELAVELELETGNGPAYIDEFRLILLAPGEANYAALAEGLETELANKIAANATFVNAPVAAGARVEYYTVSGMKVAAPKAGEIVIRKTTKNGKVVVDKILVK